MAEGVWIMRIMIMLTDKGFLKAAKNSLSAEGCLIFYLRQDNQPYFHAPIRSSLLFCSLNHPDVMIRLQILYA